MTADLYIQPLDIPERTVPPEGFADLKKLSLALVAGGLLFALAIFWITRPAKTIKTTGPAGTAEQQMEAFRKMQELQYGKPGPTAEELGVSPLDPELGKAEVIKRLGDGAYTAPQLKTKPVVTASGGEPGTGSYWESRGLSTEIVAGSQKKICSRTVYGSKARVGYKRSGDEKLAIVTVDVDQTCLMPDGTPFDGHSRSTITSELYYRWKGYTWERTPAPQETNDSVSVK